MRGIVGLGEEVVDELCADVGEGVSCIVQEDCEGAVPCLLLGLVFSGQRVVVLRLDERSAGV